MIIEKSSAADQAEILVLYRSLIGQPGCTWCEEYPDEEIVAEDLHSDSLYCARENGSIVGAVSIEWQDEEVEHFDCWSKENEPAAYLSRVAVSRSAQGKGLAKELMRRAMAEMKARGMKTARYLVSPGNEAAMRAYRALAFDFSGEADAFGQHWLCYEKRL